MEFKKVLIDSPKLNKQIELEAYDEEDKTIITTNSLKKVFESEKAARGITDSIKSDVSFNPRGDIAYVSVEWTLKDKDGYCSTFVGEANSLSLTSAVSRKYPKTTALNRAQSAGIISYLQLPGKVYSDSQIMDEVPHAVANTNSTSISKMATETEEGTSPAKITAGVIQTAAAMPADISDEESFVIPIVDESGVVEKTSAPTAEPQSEPTPVAVPLDDEINDATCVGIGTFTDVPVSEFIERYKNNDAVAIKLIEMYKAGRFNAKSVSAKKMCDYLISRLGIN